jgi:wyosine [tRNA(Phe)-imidazoG37] synthetase (radical SAM superfamily)
VDLERMINAGTTFRRRYNGSLWVEVFVVEGVNGDEESLRPVADCVAAWKPDRIHLNTVARPPADVDARPVPKIAMERLAALFTPRAEVIADFTGVSVKMPGVDDEHLVAMLARRPGRVVDVAEACGLDEPTVAGLLERLVLRGAVTRERRPDGDYYRGRGVAEDAAGRPT